MSSRIYPYACLNIDCSWSQWLSGLRRALYTSEDESDLKRKISSLFSNQDNVIITVCVRTAFDLFLQALSLPLGSEVVITSINIPEMSRILRKHGLIPVPVDIEVDTLITPAARVEAAITPRTKLILIAMLYGVTFDITDIGKIAQRHKLPLFEDCSECYSGSKFKGSNFSDATVLSFGPIKTATAFGGGVMIIRNEAVLKKVKQIHESYPRQSSKLYMKKVLKYALGMILLNSKKVNGTIRPILTALNVDYKKGVVRLMRGFPPSTGLDIYRNKPCIGLLSFLYWRLSNVDDAELMASMEKLHNATKILTDGNVRVPGFKTHRNVFWLYPVITNDATKAYKMLNNAGIDAYRGISQLNKIDPPVGSSFKEPEETNKMFKNLLYFPLHKDVDEQSVRDICMKAVEILKNDPKI